MRTCLRTFRAFVTSEAGQAVSTWPNKDNRGASVAHLLSGSSLPPTGWRPPTYGPSSLQPGLFWHRAGYRRGRAVDAVSGGGALRGTPCKSQRALSESSEPAAARGRRLRPFLRLWHGDCSSRNAQAQLDRHRHHAPGNHSHQVPYSRRIGIYSRMIGSLNCRMRKFVAPDT